MATYSANQIHSALTLADRGIDARGMGVPPADLRRWQDDRLISQFANPLPIPQPWIPLPTLQQFHTLLSTPVGVASPNPNTTNEAVEATNETITDLMRLLQNYQHNLQKVSHINYMQANYRPDQLIYIGESVKDEQERDRPEGWGPDGACNIKLSSFIRGRKSKVNMVGCITTEGMVSVRLEEGGMDFDAFWYFIDLAVLRRIANPYPLPRSVFVFDDCEFSRCPILVETIEAAGCRLVYLPPKLPDLNSMEVAFHMIKTELQSKYEREIKFSGDPAGEIERSAGRNFTSYLARSCFRVAGWQIPEPQ